MTEDELYRFQKLHEHADFLLEKLTEAKQKRMQTEEANVQLRAELDKVERKLIAVPVDDIMELWNNTPEDSDATGNVGAWLLKNYPDKIHRKAQEAQP